MKIKGDSKLIALLESALEKYPELQKFHFIIKFKKLNDAFASTGKIGNIIRISVDEEIKEQDDSIILGAIVSELTHYVIDNTSNSSMIKLFFKYTLSKSFRESLEKRVDLETIKRGFGEELLKLKIFDDEDAEEDQDEEGYYEGNYGNCPIIQPIKYQSYQIFVKFLGVHKIVLVYFLIIYLSA